MPNSTTLLPVDGCSQCSGTGACSDCEGSGHNRRHGGECWSCGSAGRCWSCAGAPRAQPTASRAPRSLQHGARLTAEREGETIDFDPTAGLTPDGRERLIRWIDIYVASRLAGAPRPPAGPAEDDPGPFTAADEATGLLLATRAVETLQATGGAFTEDDVLALILGKQRMENPAKWQAWEERLSRHLCHEGADRLFRERYPELVGENDA